MSIHWGGRGPFHATRKSNAILPPPTLAFDFVGATSLDSRITFSRGTAATFVGSNGLIQTAGINDPRFDYDPVTLQPKGLLIEESRANSFIQSGSLDNAAYNQQNITISVTKVTAPDGTASGCILSETTSNTFHRLNVVATTSFTSGTNYTVSVFVKKSAAVGAPDIVQLIFNPTAFPALPYANFNLATGTVALQSNGTATITPYKDGWYRITLTAAAGANTTGATTVLVFANNNPNAARLPVYVGSTSSEVYAWGAQLEIGAFPTSYIPTVASPVTRNADVAVMTGANFSSWYNASEGALVTETQLTRQASIASTVAASANDGTSNNALINFYRSTGNTGFQVNQGGSSQANLDNGVAITANTVAKIASAYKASDFAMSTNGGTVQTASSGNVPTVNQFELGQGVAGVALNGYIRGITYYQQRLTNETLQRLTS